MQRRANAAKIGEKAEGVLVAAKKKKTGSNLGLVDLLAIGAVAYAAFHFVPAYADWTAYRYDPVPGEECVRQMDAACARKAFDEAYGPTGAPYSKKLNQQWVWALRFIDTDEDYRRQLDTVFEEGKREILGAGLSENKAGELLGLANILYHMGRDKEATAFFDEVVERQEDADARIPELMRRYGPSQLGGPPNCLRGEKDHQFLSKGDNYAQLDVGRDFQNPCYLEYFRRRSDIDLKPVIERSLDTMRAKRQAQGEMDAWNYDGESMTRDEYVDKVAFLATLIAYREHNGWGRSFD